MIATSSSSFHRRRRRLQHRRRDDDRGHGHGQRHHCPLSLQIAAGAYALQYEQRGFGCAAEEEAAVNNTGSAVVPAAAENIKQRRTNIQTAEIKAENKTVTPHTIDVVLGECVAA